MPRRAASHHYQDHGVSRSVILSSLTLLIAFSLAFLVNTSSYLVIKRTNVVMLKLLAISRNAFVVVSSTFLFDETVTLWQVFGYCVTLVFFLSYTYIQFTDVR